MIESTRDLLQRVRERYGLDLFEKQSPYTLTVRPVAGNEDPDVIRMCDILELVLNSGLVASEPDSPLTKGNDT